MVRTTFGGQQKHFIYGCRVRDHAQFKRQILRYPQSIRIQKLFAVQADRRQYAVIERQFQCIGEPGLARQRQHPLVPQYKTHGGAGFIVGRDIRKLIRPAERLVNGLNGLLFL